MVFFQILMRDLNLEWRDGLPLTILKQALEFQAETPTQYSSLYRILIIDNNYMLRRWRILSLTFNWHVSVSNMAVLI